MAFDTPKVIISLDEYQELKSDADKNNKDEMLIAAKKIIATLLLHGRFQGYGGDFEREIRKQGIEFRVLNDSSTREPYHRIYINIIK